MGGALTLSGLSAPALGLLAVAALLIGFSKTAISGISLIAVAIAAAVLPAKLSTGFILPMLLVGDVVAVRAYHEHADFKALLRLLPAVGVGLLVGVAFIARVDSTTMRRAIGVILILLTVATVLMMRRPSRPAGAEPTSRRTASRWALGSLAGFSTMVANAGGPPMSLYLVLSRYSMLGFLGTFSWFFFLLNLAKVPFSVGLGLISWSSLALNAVLAPVVVLGGWFGRKAIQRIDQKLFERLILVTTAAIGLYLVR